MRDNDYIVKLTFDSEGSPDSYQITNNGTLMPSTAKRSEYQWLYAENNLIDKAKVDTSYAGKWILFIDKANIDEAWQKVREGIALGKIWEAKVSVEEENSTRDNLICIYVHDSDDKQAIVNTFDFIKNSGLAQWHKNPSIQYKLDKQTHANQYGPNAFLYDSSHIPELKKELAAETAMANSAEQGFFAKTKALAVALWHGISNIISQGLNGLYHIFIARNTTSQKPDSQQPQQPAEKPVPTYVGTPTPNSLNKTSLSKGVFLPGKEEGLNDTSSHTPNNKT